MAKKLYVGNLPWCTKQETLLSAINTKIDDATGALKTEGVEAEGTKVQGTQDDFFFKQDERGNARFAIVTIAEDAVADKVISLMNEMPFDAGDERGPRQLIVNEARPREDRPRDDRRGGYNNRGSNGGRREGGYKPSSRGGSYNSYGSDNFSQN